MVRKKNAELNVLIVCQKLPLEDFSTLDGEVLLSSLVKQGR